MPSRWLVLSRIAAGIAGGYAFTWGFTSLGIVLLVAAGLPYGEAQTALYLLAFLVFLGLICWAFAAASVVRVWLVLAGGAALMTAAAWAIARALVAAT
jgi:hypothetical protein